MSSMSDNGKKHLHYFKRYATLKIYFTKSKLTEVKDFFYNILS